MSDLTEREPLRELPPPRERLRLRKLFGVTQQELAKSLGVTRKTVGSWEKGESEPTGSNRADYASVLFAWAATEQDRARESAERSAER